MKKLNFLAVFAIFFYSVGYSKSIDDSTLEERSVLYYGLWKKHNQESKSPVWFPLFAFFSSHIHLENKKNFERLGWAHHFEKIESTQKEVFKWQVHLLEDSNQSEPTTEFGKKLKKVKLGEFSGEVFFEEVLDFEQRNFVQPLLEDLYAHSGFVFRNALKKSPVLYLFESPSQISIFKNALDINERLEKTRESFYRLQRLSFGEIHQAMHDGRFYNKDFKKSPDEFSKNLLEEFQLFSSINLNSSLRCAI